MFVRNQRAIRDMPYPRSSLELRIVGRAFTARQARRKAAPYVNSSDLRLMIHHISVALVERL